MGRRNTILFPTPVLRTSPVRDRGTRSSSCSNRLSVRTARSREDLAAAFTVLQRRYGETGLGRMANTSMRIMPYQLSSASQVFVAEMSGRIVGTVTLVRDSFDGLPIASSYSDAINSLRRRTRQIGEITSLAIDSSRSSQVEIFSQLTRLLTFFAREQGLQHLAAVVHPRHAKFYQHALGFEIIGEESPYGPVGGNPGVAVLGSVNDPSRYRPRWRDYYFKGNFPAGELQPISICSEDYAYFVSKLTHNVRRRRFA